jgi:methyl-accepting chemotaxis protein
MNTKLSSIAVRLPVAIAALCLVVAGSVSYLGYRGAVQGLNAEVQQKLELALHAHVTALENEFESIANDLAMLDASPLVSEALLAFRDGRRAVPGDANATLRRWYVDANPNPTGEKDRLDRATEPSAYNDAHARFHRVFRDLKDRRGYYDVFLIDEAGEVVYTVFKEPDFATNLSTGQWAGTALGQVYRQAMETGGQQVFTDYAPYAPSNGVPAGFVGMRIDAADGTPLGAIVFQLPNDRINTLANTVSGLGETGHITLIGPDMTTRNVSRFENDFGFLAPVPEQEIPRLALAGESGFLADVRGHDGAAAMVAYMPVKLWGTSWAGLVEQDRAEVLAPAAALRSKMILTLAACALVSAGLGWILGRSIARPLNRLAAAMDRVRSGAYDTEVPFRGRKDEIGQISANLLTFRDGLKDAESGRRMTIFKGRAFATSGTAMMLVDRDLRILDYNEALRVLFTTHIDSMRHFWPDFDPERLTGVNIDRFHKDPEKQRRLLGDVRNLPYVADIALGELRLGLTISPILDEAGEYIGCALQWEDVREARVNKSIIEAIRRNQSMIEYTPDFVIRNVNDNFTKVYGHGAEVIGQNFETLFGPNEDTRIQMERLRSGLTVQRKVERKRKDGHSVFVEISMTPIRDRSGRLDRVVEIASDVTTLEAARVAAEAERDRQAGAQKQVVDDLRRGLSSLAEGDLTQHLDQPFAADYEALRHNFNSAQAQLSETMAKLVTATGNINSGAVEISQAADDLSRRTENQAATLEETAAALDELTASVRSATEGAAAADRAVRSAREGAEASGQVVLQAVNAMSEIEKSSGQIGQIIGVIDDIAFQTNLLALNAGVEAARAGEAGRGFAVVASEVRSLAQRSSEAAKEIKSLISASSQQVERGVALVGDTGRALHEIVANVANISTLVSEIAASSREQSTGLGEINTGVNQLDQVTQQNAAMVEQSTAASHSLKQEAEILADLVAQFRIPSLPGQAAPVRARTEAARPAPARAAATGTDGWEEF